MPKQPRTARAQPPRRRVRNTLRRRPASADDVARLAGVSRSAVSRTFTEGASVASHTRERVLAAAKTLKYRPNLFARSLKTMRSSIIGVAVSELDNQHYPEILELLSEQLERLGYRLLLFVTHGSRGHDPLTRELLRYHLDALILASSSLSSALAVECRAAGVPVIMFNNVDAAANVPSIAGTNEQGARLIAAFLAAGGHRRMAYLGGMEGDSTDQERRTGFSAALLELGLPEPAQASGRFTFAGATEAARILLRASRSPEAIFCVNDHSALATLEVARAELGLQPGKDISIVGFDNVPVSAWPSFSLTTYSQPASLMVSRLVAALQELLEHRPIALLHQRIEGELIVRGSARAPRSGLITRTDGSRTWRPT